MAERYRDTAGRHARLYGNNGAPDTPPATNRREAIIPQIDTYPPPHQQHPHPFRNNQGPPPAQNNQVRNVLALPQDHPMLLLQAYPVNGFFRVNKDTPRNHADDPRPANYVRGQPDFIPATPAVNEGRILQAQQTEADHAHQLAQDGVGFLTSGQTHFKDIHDQTIHEPKERTRIQACKYFLSGEVDSDDVAQFVSPLVWMNDTNTRHAVSASKSIQSKWKSRTIKQVQDATYEIAETSGGINLWTRLTPEQRRAIWNELINVAPSVVANNMLMGERDSVSFQTIFLHGHPQLQKWKVFTQEQMLRICETVFINRVAIGVWIYPGKTPNEGALYSDYKHRTRNMEHLNLGTLMDIPTHASRTRGLSRKFRSGLSTTPGLEWSDADNIDDGFFWNRQQ